MKPPTSLEAIKHERVNRIMVTGALKDGHWLLHEENHLDKGALILFVADNLQDVARVLWPGVSMDTPQGIEN